MSAEWTKAELKAFAPEFTAVSDATLDLYIGYAEQLVNPEVFGDLVKFAGLNMTAHLLTVLPPAGAVAAVGGHAPVTSRTVGSVSVTYATSLVSMQATPGALAMSKYGVNFSMLTNRKAIGFGLL